MAVDRWEDRKVLKKVRREMERRMKKGMLLLQGKVQRKLSTGQPVRRSGSILIGLDPSSPGQPPRVVSSSLKNSIDHDVKGNSREVVGRVGSNLVYARRQELGFIGTDNLGRNVHHEPRPYLRPGFKENLSTLVRMLGGRPR